MLISSVPLYKRALARYRRISDKQKLQSLHDGKFIRTEFTVLWNQQKRSRQIQVTSRHTQNHKSIFVYVCERMQEPKKCFAEKLFFTSLASSRKLCCTKNPFYQKTLRSQFVSEFFTLVFLIFFPSEKHSNRRKTQKVKISWGNFPRKIFFSQLSKRNAEKWLQTPSEGRKVLTKNRTNTAEGQTGKFPPREVFHAHYRIIARGWQITASIFLLSSGMEGCVKNINNT